jgi:hypothetical protein
MGLRIHIGLILSLLFLSSLFSVAQNKTIVIHGKVTDKDHHGIPYAAIQNANTGEGINCNANGLYILKVTLPAKLDAFSLGYNVQEKQVNPDSTEMDFTLAENPTELGVVTISASYPAVLVSESPTLMDFEIQNNKLWLVYAMKNGDKIEVVDTGGRHITQTNYNYFFRKDSIGKTPYGLLYSTTPDSVLLFSLNEHNAIEMKGMEIGTYKTYTRPLAGFRYPYYYYVSFDSMGSRLNYSFYDKYTNAQKVFYRYMDTKLDKRNTEIEEEMLTIQMALLLSDSVMNPAVPALTKAGKDTLLKEAGMEPNYANIKQALENYYGANKSNLREVEDALTNAQQMIDAGLDPTNNRYLQNHLSMAHSERSTVFSMLRIAHDSVYIFNFDNSTISVYDQSNTYVRQVPFNFYLHVGFSWKPLRKRNIDIMIDDQTGECYFRYKKIFTTYLEKIDLNTGKVVYNVPLEKPFVSKVRVSGGYAYFSYFDSEQRDNIYNGKTCIFKQKLD